MSFKELKSTVLFSPEHSEAFGLLSEFEYPWEALPEIRAFTTALGRRLVGGEYKEISENVWMSETARIAPSARIEGPCVIGGDTEIRHCAFIRGAAIIGRGCVVGNSTEIKNSILFDGAAVPHFNYVGDSVLGFLSHFGASAVASNVKSDRSLISIALGRERIQTGLVKLGAIVGDYSEIGCGSVLYPGTVLGKGCTVYPLAGVRGFIPGGCIYKADGSIVRKTEQKRQ